MEIQVEYTEALLKKAAWRFALGHIKRFILAGIILLIPGLIGLNLFVNHAEFHAVSTGFMIAGILIPFLAMWKISKNTFNTSLKVYLKLNSRIIHFIFSEEEFGIRSELSEGASKWKLFQELRCFEDMWLMFPDSLGFYILPTAQLTPEIQELILRKMRENNIKVRGKKIGGAK